MITPAALLALASGQAENFIAATIPGGIEAQEKAGQIEQSFAETLPKQLDDRAAFEKLGFVFGEDADDIFINAKFPQGWRKKPIDHSMWSEILDDKGRVRGLIFYKAAFYDRSAHAGLSHRFSVERTYGKKDESVTVRVKDACGKITKEVSGLAAPDWNDHEQGLKHAAGIDKASSDLTVWLDGEYPDWRSPLAYWD